MEIFDTLMPVHLNIFPSTHGLLENIFLNLSIGNLSEQDYTWNFKFSNLSFLHTAIVKLHAIHGKNFSFLPVFWGEWGHSKSQGFLGN